MSSRASTVRSTRASLSRQLGRVAEGRVSRSRSRVPKSTSRKLPHPPLSLAQEIRNLQEETKEGEEGFMGGGLGRAALLAGGMAVSIGSALLLSTTTTPSISFSDLSQQVIQTFQAAQERVVQLF